LEPFSAALSESIIAQFRGRRKTARQQQRLPNDVSLASTAFLFLQNNGNNGERQQQRTTKTRHFYTA